MFTVTVPYSPTLRACDEYYEKYSKAFFEKQKTDQQKELDARALALAGTGATVGLGFQTTAPVLAPVISITPVSAAPKVSDGCTWLPMPNALAEKVTDKLQSEAGQSEADLLAAHIANNASTETEISKGITMSTAEGPNGIMDVNIIVDSALNRAPDSAMAQALDAARNGPRGGQNQGRGQNQSRGQNHGRGVRIARGDHEEK